MDPHFPAAQCFPGSRHYTSLGQPEFPLPSLALLADLTAGLKPSVLSISTSASILAPNPFWVLESWFIKSESKLSIQVTFLVVSLGLSWNLETPALADKNKVMGEQRQRLGAAERRAWEEVLHRPWIARVCCRGSWGPSALCLAPLEASLCLLVTGRKPPSPLPCSPGGPFSASLGMDIPASQPPWEPVERGWGGRAWRASPCSRGSLSICWSRDY